MKHEFYVQTNKNTKTNPPPKKGGGEGNGIVYCVLLCFPKLQKVSARKTSVFYK